MNMSEFDDMQKWATGLVCHDMKKILCLIEEKGYRIALVKGAKVKEVSPLLLFMIRGALKDSVREIEESLDE